MKQYLDNVALQEYTTKLTQKYKTVFATKTDVGSPLVANTAADMTDTNKVYVYAGNESGYVNGDWYYYDGTEWQDGGTYNSAGIETDETLTESGMAADAKVVGDKFDEVAAELTAEEEKIDNVLNPFVLDWNDIGATSIYPLGWRSGYWTDAGDYGTNVNYIQTSLRIRAYPDSSTYPHDFNGIYKIKVNLPEGKTLVVKEWNKSDVTVLTHRWDLSDGDSFPVDKDCMYGFNLGFDSDATSYLNEAYLAQIQLTLYPAIRKKRRSTEFERFSVKVNIGWPDITSTRSTNAEPITEQNVRCIISLPESYKDTGKPTPAIMLSHGSGGEVGISTWNSNSADFLALVRAFTAAGYAVFDVDNTQGESSGWPDWGCLPLCTAYLKAWEKIKRFYNVEDGLYIYALSMGTTAALNIMKWHSCEIKAAVISGIRPVCETAYNAASSSVKLKMAQSFGLSGSAWETERLKGFNQYENAVTIGNKEYILEKFPPVKILIGTADSNYLTEARAYSVALNNAGNYVNKREISGADHNAMCFLTPGSLRQEVVNWFDRFRD